MARLRFNIRVSDRTEITANPNEISMGMRVMAFVGEPVLIGEKDIVDAAIQQFGKKLGTKRVIK